MIQETERDSIDERMQLKPICFRLSWTAHYSHQKSKQAKLISNDSHETRFCLTRKNENLGIQKAHGLGILQLIE